MTRRDGESGRAVDHHPAGALPEAELRAALAADAPRLARLIENVERVFRGKTETVKLALVALLARGHVLFEDVPGVGKTTLARAVARSLDCRFRRIQFTSDMLPSDVLGTTIFDRDAGRFSFQPGPIFTNVLLADEINRTPPRTQSALLEALNEGQVTVDDQTHRLADPFVVMATQNPKEHYGTYPLPESQLDRFLMRVHIGYPETAVEQEIIRSQGARDGTDDLRPVVTGDEIVAMQRRVEHVRVEASILDYLVRVVELTRTSPLLELGVSTRGAISLYRAAQARAWLDGRDYCIPDDVKSLVIPVFCHRVWVQARMEHSAEERDQAANILGDILDSVPIPL